MPKELSTPRLLTDLAFDKLAPRLEAVPSQSLLQVDMGATEWIDLLALAMLTQTIGSLQQRDISVTLKPPARRSVYQFMLRYGATTAIERCGALIIRPPKALDQPVRSIPVLPLEEFDEAQLNGLLKRLGDPQRHYAILEDLANDELIKHGLLRDVIARELGYNVFLHAESTRQLMGMVFYEATEVERRKTWLKAIGRNVGAVERSFYGALRGHAHATFVISDNGLGIPTTLRAAYLQDKGATPDGTTDGKILEFSFEYHSSRRSVPERIGEVARYFDALLAGDDTAVPPPTGLNRLLRLVEQRRGLLVARSGKARVGFDCLSSSTPKVVVSDGLSSAVGTHFKVVIPQLPHFGIARSIFVQSTAGSADIAYKLVRSSRVTAGMGAGWRGSVTDILAQLNTLTKASAEHPGRRRTVDARGPTQVPGPDSDRRRAQSG